VGRDVFPTEGTTRKGERISLLELIRRNRARFVLKPNDDYSGHLIVTHAVHIRFLLDYSTLSRDANAKERAFKFTLPLHKAGE